MGVLLTFRNYFYKKKKKADIERGLVSVVTFLLYRISYNNLASPFLFEAISYNINKIHDTRI